MQRFNKAVALLLCMVMLIGFVPVSVLVADAAGNPTIVVAGSDYQASNSGTTMKSIISQMGYDSIDGVLMGGDYNGGSTTYSSAAEVKAVDTALTNAGVSTSADRIYVQGNHDTNLSPSDSSNLLSTEGEHDTDYYGVYVINQEDFPWQNSSSTLVGNTASALGKYLDAKVSANYSKPIFVVTHLPLHVSSRGDNKYARLIFNELEEAGEAGLNIIFLFGHNHSGGHDAYLGNGSIYLPKGSSLTVVDGSSSTYTDSSISFTYMNYGYLGNIAGSSCTHQTMTAFEITDTQVTVKRYDTDSQHLLKEKGAAVSGYNTNANEYGYAVIDLADGTSVTYGLSDDSGSDDTGSNGGTNGGTTGGSNVGTTGGSGSGSYTYELVTSIEAGEKYVIVGNDDDVALMDNGGEMGTQSVTISGTTLTSTVALTEWTISGTSGGTIVSDQGNGLSYSSSSFNLTGAADNTFNISDGNDDNFTILTVRTNSSYSKYYFNYDGSGWTSKPTSAAYVRIYKLTGTGSGGGSTVTPEDLGWVTISDGKGQVVYELDTDGVIDTGIEYLIVDNEEALALSAAASSNNTLTVELDGNYAYTDSEDYGWVFASSGGDYTIRLNGSTYLGRSSSDLTTGSSSSTWTAEHDANGEYYIMQESSSSWWASTYYLRYTSNGSKFQAGTTRTPVRLYKYLRTEAAGDAEYAKLDGELTYTVSRGTSAEEALAAVKEGINVVVSSDQSAETILDDGDENITWTMSGYDGTVAGEYAVTISYKGVKLGTAKVIVPEVTITGYDCQTLGSVKVGASGKTRTGANITVNLEDGTSYTVPVTLDMLSGDFTTDEAGEYTGLTVTYNGVVVCEDFTLTVREPSSYPEYPDEGAVQVKKTGTGVQFQSTGVAQVEISASGIPMNQGVDVLLILDTSSSMGMQGSLTDSGRTRMDVLKECVNALIVNLKAERADGSVPDVSIAVVDFNGYTGNKSTNYIGSTARDTSTLGGLLTDGWVDVQNMSDTWANSSIPSGSGTNYDHGLLQAYDLLSARQEEESSRKQFVLFMSDGAPFQYNGVNSNSLSSDWENWILGSYTQDEVEALSHVSNPEFYYGNNGGNGQKHRVAEAIKGTGSFEIVTYSDTSSTGTTKLETVPGLGVTMYSVGLALEGTNMPTDAAGQEAILKTIASSEDVFYSVTSAAGLQEAFDDFAGEVLMAATNARFVDQMGDAYDLQMGTIKDLNGNAIDVENKIEILSYDIWTRSDYLAGKCTADQIGDRKGTYTVLETVTFNADGSEAYSDKIDGGQTNILADGTQEGFEKGVIYARSFMYNTNEDKAVPVNGVSIPTGVDESGLTTGTTNMLPAETFYWNIGTIKTTELAMRYYVYLEGSMEGTREAGSYPTNNYANLYYNNYLNQPIGQPCVKDTVSPVLAWDAANVSYAFYLVDENGNIVVNQTTGETGSFANKVAVTNPVVYKEVLLNNTGNVESIEVASLGVLPEGYELYDEDAVYTIQIKSDATGSWTIAQGVGTVASTYVTQYDPNNAAAYTNDLTKNSDADFTHTVVWFAVLWKVQALPDAVVIDYGLPVDVSVLANDMFGENGKLAGIGAYSDSLNLDGHDDALASGFGDNYTGTYGSAEINVSTGKVRYQLNSMEMNGCEKFAYAVNYTGATNPGYYYDTVTVIPATTIYFEDSFLELKSYTWNNDWVEVKEGEEKWVWSQEGTTVDGVQAEDRPGQYSLTDANNIYGYDAVNNAMSTYSMGSAMKATVDYDNYASASFSFWGTGFDVVSMTTVDTGTLAVNVTTKQAVTIDGKEYAAGALVKSMIVDTYYGYNQDDEGNWVVDPTNTDCLYQVPVMEVEDLPYGQYQVEIQAMYEPIFDNIEGSDRYELYLDAIRIYDPANDGAGNTTIEDAYVADHEGWPSYIELRNSLIAVGSFADMASQEGMVFIDGDSEVGDAQLSDYVGYGPNNEVYLAKGQSVAFLVDSPSTADRIHIGIKSADGQNVQYTIKNVARNSNADKGIDAGEEYGVKTGTINTATDMYYDMTGWKNDIVVITNSGTSGILSITNIKSTYKENPAANGDVDAQNVRETRIYMTAEAANVVVNAMKPAPVNPFADIQKDQFFYESILWAVENGITNGISDTHFGPYLYCNRAQVVTFLWRAAGSPEPVSRVNPFADVPEDSWYTDAVLWAVENGITNGLSADTFGPDVLCNRAQVVTFLWRANGSKVVSDAANPFADVPADAFYHDAVVWALKNGITTGATPTEFNPSGSCMRAHVVTFLYRAEQLPEYEVAGWASES